MLKKIRLKTEVEKLFTELKTFGQQKSVKKKREQLNKERNVWEKKQKEWNEKIDIITQGVVQKFQLVEVTNKVNQLEYKINVLKDENKYKEADTVNGELLKTKREWNIINDKQQEAIQTAIQPFESKKKKIANEIALLEQKSKQLPDSNDNRVNLIKKLTQAIDKLTSTNKPLPASITGSEIISIFKESEATLIWIHNPSVMERVISSPEFLSYYSTLLDNQQQVEVISKFKAHYSRNQDEIALQNNFRAIENSIKPIKKYLLLHDRELKEFITNLEDKFNKLVNNYYNSNSRKLIDYYIENFVNRISILEKEIPNGKKALNTFTQTTEFNEDWFDTYDKKYIDITQKEKELKNIKGQIEKLIKDEIKIEKSNASKNLKSDKDEIKVIKSPIEVLDELKKFVGDQLKTLEGILKKPTLLKLTAQVLSKHHFFSSKHNQEATPITLLRNLEAQMKKLNSKLKEKVKNLGNPTQSESHATKAEEPKPSLTLK